MRPARGALQGGGWWRRNRSQRREEVLCHLSIIQVELSIAPPHCPRGMGNGESGMGTGIVPVRSVSSPRTSGPFLETATHRTLRQQKQAETTQNSVSADRLVTVRASPPMASEGASTAMMRTPHAPHVSQTGDDRAPGAPGRSARSGRRDSRTPYMRARSASPGPGAARGAAADGRPGPPSTR